MADLTQICPFCALHCDGVRRDQTTGVMNEEELNCQIANAAFAATADRRGRIETQICDSDQVQNHVRELIADVAQPVVLASLVDLATARGLQSIDASGRIRLFTEPSPSESAIRSSMVRDGMISGTLGDVRKHADVVWIIGDIAATAPRFIAEVIRQPAAPTVLQFDGGVSVDEVTAFSAAVETNGGRRCVGRMSELIDSLYGPANANRDSGENTAFAARYLAVVVASDAFDADAALAAAPVLNRAVMKLNRSIRAVLVPMDAAATLRSVSAWSQNGSLPVWDWNARSSPLDVSGIRIGGPRAGVARDDAGGASRVAVQIGGVDGGPESATCYLPASIPGLDRDGFVVRGDGSVSLPLAGLKVSARPELPSASELLASLLG